MKPDWKDSPDWARWLAMNEDGSWTFYEFRPRNDFGCWWDDKNGRELDVSAQWMDSLEERP